MIEIRVFISSPSDVMAERQRIERVIERINVRADGRFRIQGYRWERGQYYTARDTFQAQIPETGGFDLVLAVLGHRLGTELPPGWPPMPDGRPYPSGTAYEILTALEASRAQQVPEVYVFRKQSAPSWPADEKGLREAISQWDRLNNFWQDVFVTRDGHFKAAFQTYRALEEFEAAIDELLNVWLVRKELLHAGATWSIGSDGSPFRGLEPFESRHAPVFFGRQKAVELGADRLADAAARGRPFLLIVGPSGAGKSSLARAGLVPRLTAPGAFPGVDHWRFALLTPGGGGGPVRALANALLSARDDAQGRESGLPPAVPEIAEGDLRTPAELAIHFADQPDGRLQESLSSGAVLPILRALERVAEAERRKEGLTRPLEVRLLLLVDQIEQLFAQGIAPELRQRFAALLEALVTTGRVVLVATLRADAYDRFVSEPALLRLKEAGATLDVAVPGPADLASIVREPARAAGLVYEHDPLTGDGLDDRLLREAGTADTLPLLQFTLQRLFEERVEIDGAPHLRFSAYDALGGLDGAIGRVAEEALMGAPTGNPPPLGGEALAALPILLRHLVRLRVGDDRPAAVDVPLGAVAPEDSAARRLVDRLTDARILVTDRGPSGETVRLAHEAVLRSWPRAASILADSILFLRVRGQVEVEEEQWRAAHQSRDLLIPPGVRLAEAEEIVRRFPEEVEPRLSAFVAASSRRARTRQRLTQAAAAALAVLFLAAAAAGLFAWRAQQEAQVQSIAAQASAAKAMESEAEARDRAAEARRQAARAREEEAKAIAQTQRAESASQRAWDGLGRTSRFLAQFARQEMMSGDAQTSINLALEALPADIGTADKPFVRSAWTALYEATDQDRSVALFAGHERPVWSTAFSPDGRRLATGSVDTRVRIFDLRTGLLRRTLAGHEDVVTGLAFSPDGRRLVSVGGKLIQVWDPETGARLATLTGHTAPIQRVVFFPDGRRFATSAYDSTVRIWDAVEGRLIRTIHGPNISARMTGAGGGDTILSAVMQATARIFGTASLLALSPDGRQIVTGSHVDAEAAAHVYDVETGGEVLTLRGHASQMDDQFTDLAFSPDGRLIGTASGDGTARLWDAVSGEERAVLSGHNGSVARIAFSPDGTRVLTGGVDRIARLWDAATGRSLASLAGHAEQISGLAFSPDGSLAATAAQDRTVRLWDGVTGEAQSVMRGQAGILTVGFSPDGDTLVSAGRDGTARLWRTRPPTPVSIGQFTGTNRFREPELPRVVLAPGGRRALVVTDEPSRIRGAPPRPRFVDLARKRTTAAIEGANPRFLSQGDRIVTTDGSNLRLYDAVGGGLVATLPGGFFNGSASGRLMLVGRDSGAAALVETERATVLREIAGHGGKLRFGLIGPGDGAVLTVTDSRAVITPVSGAAPPVVLATEGESLRFAALDDAGRRLLTLSDENHVRLWSWPQGGRLADLGDPNLEVRIAAFSADGRRVVTANRDGSGTVWDAATGRAVETRAPASSADDTPFLASTDRSDWEPFAPMTSAGDAAAAQRQATLREGRGRETGAGGRSPFSPDGSWLLLASGRAWYPGEGREAVLPIDAGETRPVSGRAIDGGHYAVISRGRLRVVETATGRVLADLAPPGETVRSFSVDLASGLAATVSNESGPVLWRMKDGREVARLASPTAPVSEVSIALRTGPDGAGCPAGGPVGQAVILTRDEKSGARLWREDGTLLVEARPARPVPIVPALDLGACNLLAETAQGATVFDTATGAESAVIEGGAEISAVEFAPDGRHLVVARTAGTVSLIDLRDGHLAAAVEGPTQRESGDRAWSLLGATLAVATARSDLALVDVATGQARTVPGLAIAGISNALVSRGGARIAVADRAGSLWLVDARQAQVVARIRTGTAGAVVPATSEAANRYDDALREAGKRDDSPSSASGATILAMTDTRLLVRGEGARADLYDVADGRQLAEIPFPNSRTDDGLGATVSEDGQRLLFLGEAGAPTHWDLEAGRALPLAAGPPAVRATFAADGRIAALGADGTLRILDGRTGAPLAVIVPDGPLVAKPESIGADRLVVEADEGRRLKILDIASGRVVFETALTAEDRGPTFGSSTTIDEAVVAAGGATLAIRRAGRWSLWHPSPKAAWTREADPATQGAQLPVLAGDRLIFADPTGASVIDGRSGAVAGRVAWDRLSLGDDPPVSACAAGRDRVVLMSGGRALLSTLDGSMRVSLSSDADPAAALTCDAEGGVVATVTAGGAVRFQSAETGSNLVEIAGRAKAPRGNPSAEGLQRATFVGGGRAVLATPELRTGSVVLDTASGRQLAGDILAADPTGERLILARQDGDIFDDKTAYEVIDAARGTVLATLARDGSRFRPRSDFNAQPSEGVAVQGGVFLTAEADRTVRVWDLRTGRPDGARTIALPGIATALAAVPDRGAAAIGLDDGSVLLASLGTPEEPRRLGEHGAAVVAMALDPRGLLLATASADGTARLWRVADGVLLATFEITVVNRAGVTFGAEGRRLLLMGARGSLLIDTDTSKILARLATETDRYDTPARFSDDGAWLLIKPKSGARQLVNARTGRVRDPFPLLKDDENEPVLSPDGRRLAGVLDDRRLGLWEVATGRLLGSLEGPAGTLRRVVFGPDGGTVAALYGSGVLRIWRTETRERLTEIAGLGGDPVAAFSGDGRRAALAGERSSRVRIVDLATGMEAPALVSNLPVSALTFFPDHVHLVVHGPSRTRVFDLRDGRPAGTIEADLRQGRAEALTLVASAEGLRLIHRFSTTTVYDGGTGAELGDLFVSASDLQQAIERRLRPDAVAVLSPVAARVVVSDGNERDALLFDGAAGRRIARLGGHRRSLARAVLGASGRRVFTLSVDGTGQLWDGGDGTRIAGLDLGRPIVDARFSPGEDLLAVSVVSLGDDRKARESVLLVEVASGRILHDLGSAATGLSNDHGELTFSPDGQRLTAALGTTLRAWRVAGGTPLWGRENAARVRTSPDGERMAVVSSERRQVILLSAETGGIVAALDHAEPVGDLTFLPDGSSLAVASGWAVRLWDVASGTPLRDLDLAPSLRTDANRREAIRGLAASPDGTALAAVTRGSLGIYRTGSAAFPALPAPQALIDLAEMLVPQGLDRGAPNLAFLPATEGRDRFATWAGRSRRDAPPDWPACDQLAGDPREPERRGEGLPLFKIDVPAALAACEAAVAAHPGSARARHQLARALEAGGQSERSARAYLEAAELGHPVAAYLAGNILTNGFGGVTRQPERAAAWYETAAERGYPDALARRALRRRQEGKGPAAEAVRLLAEAAGRCSVLAHEVLGNDAVLAAAPDWSAALYHALMAYRCDVAEEFPWPPARIAFLARKVPGETAVATGLRARREPISADPL